MPQRSGKISLAVLSVSAVGVGVVVVGLWYVLSVIAFMWTGLEKRTDVTHEQYYHGGFEIGGCYRLKHGVYLYDSGNSDIMALNAPGRYNAPALQQAVRELGDIEAIQDGWNPADDSDWNDPPTVESLKPGEIPTQFEGIVPAGTRLRVERIERVTGGDQIALAYHARILDGALAETEVRIDPLTNYGWYGFERPGSGYWPNPLILEPMSCE